jgi:hypothetical protein
MHEPRKWIGFSYEPVDVLQQEIDEWQILSESSASHYYEIADWLDDKISQDQDGDPDTWAYPIEADLDSDGTVVLKSREGA